LRLEGLDGQAEACTNRFLDAVNQNDPQMTKAKLRRYVEVTYCNRFARKGWVYDDGALSIDAQRWLVHGRAAPRRRKAAAREPSRAR
jgi:hypothetical protein